MVPTSRRAFDDAILPLRASLMHMALGLTRNASDARDLVQDALERALREWTRFAPGTNARAWVGAILSRLFIDNWRRRRRQPRLVEIELVEVAAARWSGGGWLSHAGDDAPTPEPWEAVAEADLEWAIARLPPKLRTVFELNAIRHLSYLEISTAAGIPVNTVGTRLLRARRQLRARLEDRIATSGASREERPATPAAARVRTPTTEWMPPSTVSPPLALAPSLRPAPSRRSINASASKRQRQRHGAATLTASAI